MSDERSPSQPPEPPEDASAAEARPSSSIPPNSGTGSAPDTVRLPPIPGLIPPRFPSRVPFEGSLRASAPPAESQGLKRPYLPQRKPMPSPLFDSEPPHATASEEEATENKIFTGAPVRPTPRPRRLVPPPKPVPSSIPAAANSTGTGTAPRRRMTPAPHSPATITAMRIISIGVEDKPPPSEYTNSAVEHEAKASPSTSAWACQEPLPAFDRESPAHQTALSERPASPPITSEVERQLAPLPSFELTQPEPAITELAPLPSFEMADTEASVSDSQDAVTVPLAMTRPEPEPLPAFDMPEVEPAPSVAAVEPLPHFEIVKPIDAPPDLELIPIVPSAAAEPVPEELPPPLPRSLPKNLSSLPAAPMASSSPELTTTEPEEIAEEDVAPASVKPPPKPPARPSASLRAAAPKSEPPAPPSRSSVPPATESADAASAAAASAVADANEATGAGTKRIPPPPPRRSLSIPTEGQPEDAAKAQPAAAADAAPVTEAPADNAKADEKEKAARVRHPWWEELFNEDFSRALIRLSDEQIKREATFIEDSLGVSEGGVVLDLGCGPGYHAVELAERGYAVVGYDLSLHQLALAADVAQERHQKLNLMQGDMREMAFDSVFDGIYCWNTTFGYFEEEKNVAVAERIFKALKPGGTFLVDVVNRDFVTMQQPSSVWFEGDSAVCMDDMTVDFITSRLRVKRSLMLDDGRTKECPYSIRLYSLHELGKLLHDVGFRVAEASGQPSTPGVFMGQNAPRIIILAQRP